MSLRPSLTSGTGRTGGILFGGQAGNLDESITSAEISSILKCPSCFEIPELPITLCERGHSVCSSCRRTNEMCVHDSCEGAFTNIRNFVCEVLITKTNFRCKYLEQGCEMLIKGDEFTHHVSYVCQYRPICCNLKPCVNKPVVMQAYLQHMRTQHGVPGKVLANTVCDVTISQNLSVILQKQEEMDGIPGEGIGTIGLGVDNWPSYYISFNGEMFFLYTMVVNNMVYWWVTLLNHTEQKGGKYRTNLILKSQKTGQMVKWTGLAYSFRSEFEQIKSVTTSVIPLSNLKRIFGGKERSSSVGDTLMGEDQRLNWNIRLSIDVIC